MSTVRREPKRLVIRRIVVTVGMQRLVARRFLSSAGKRRGALPDLVVPFACYRQPGNRYGKCLLVSVE